MTQTFSIYLDLVRFSAAFAVFLAHFSSEPITKDVVSRQLGAYGSLAVTVFFVLSGYVISYVSASRENSAGTYFASRVSRLYSVVLVALPLTFLVDALGIHFNPEFYGTEKVLMKPVSWEGYFASIFFVNEFQVFGFDGISPGTNGPYWSLSFEATYYLLAGFALFSRPVFWIPISLFTLLLAGPTIAALFPVWILGFALHRNQSLVIKSQRIALVVFIATLAFVMAVPFVRRFLPHDNFGIFFPHGRGPFNKDIIYDYVGAVAFCLHLIAAKSLFANELTAPAFFEKSVRWLGSLTFPMYVLHFPLLCFFAAIGPWGNESAASSIFVFALTILLVIGLTPLCDSLKLTLRRVLSSRLPA